MAASPNSKLAIIVSLRRKITKHPLIQTDFAGADYLAQARPKN
jgi:hypothetical protein